MLLRLLFALHFIKTNLFSIFNSEKDFRSCVCQDESINFPQKQMSIKHHLINFNPKNVPEYLPKVLKTAFGYETCEFSPDFLKLVEKRLKKIIVGQNDALRTILNHLSTHFIHKSPLKKSPLVLHFAGDFGVGKTLTASVISSFLFKDHKGKDLVNHGGTLLISGSKYLPKQSDNNKEQNDKLIRLRERILHQIKKCPNSLIILNDLQKMDSRIFSKLEDFFEGSAYTENNKPIVTKSAIFILTSDLGSADLSRPWSFYRFETEIKKRFSLYTNFNNKLESFVIHVPFHSLKKNALKRIFSNELAISLGCNPAYQCVEIKTKVIEFLLKKWEESDLIQKMNGRAFHKYIYPTFIENELRKLSLLDSKPKFSRILILDVEENKNMSKIVAHEQYKPTQILKSWIGKDEL